MKYYGGVEGGATHSRLIICDESGECISQATGLGTNHWMLGITECIRRIVDMVQRAKADAHIPPDTPLSTLGLSLSGCEHEETNKKLEKELLETHPNVTESCVVSSDTLGSIFTASPIGGMVVISGTGSNALLRNPNGSTHNCGGWGHFLGDEGSAWYISHRAVKIVFDDMDNFARSQYPIEHTWQLIQEHFKVKTRHEMLPHCYADFEKPFFASLCKKLAQAAEAGDELCLYLFREAGQHLARSINSLLPFVQAQLVQSGYLNVVCVGSVWQSWAFLKAGFVEQINRHPHQFGLKLVTITKSMAFGACYLGADSKNYELPRDYTENFTVMYSLEANANKLHNCNGNQNGIAK